MKRYETIFIVQADLPDEDINSTIDRYQNILTNLKGTLINVERWGKKKMAYAIGKKNRGFYTLLDYASQSNVVSELERNFKIDDKVLKYMTILKSEKVNWEQIEKERAEAKRKEAAIEESPPKSNIAEEYPGNGSEENKPANTVITHEAFEAAAKEGRRNNDRTSKKSETHGSS
jgi:small subunit ribosomal protein S6